jgi:pimeloyl-ACP methyl ester carboxylesterase
MIPSQPFVPTDSVIVSVAPVTLETPGRGVDLEVRVTVPVEGGKLPILLFSHGNGQSLYAYGPLANYWAGQGFAVFQPTHLDSRMLALAPDDPRRVRLWESREQDLIHLLDELHEIEAAVKEITGRLDYDKIAVAGHSWGAQTASMLLGATHPDPDNDITVDIKDGRVKAGLLLAIPGTGGANLSEFAAKNFPFMNPDFCTMNTPALIVAGDDDRGAMTVRGPDWWREAYDLSPGRKALLTVFGGQHSLGGIPNYEARETTDESPARVAAIQKISTAFLKSVLSDSAATWEQAATALSDSGTPQGVLESK